MKDYSNEIAKLQIIETMLYNLVFYSDLADGNRAEIDAMRVKIGAMLERLKPTKN